MATLAIRLITTPANSVPSERAFSVQNMIHTKLRNRMGAVKAAKLVFIYINSRALKYKWDLQEKKDTRTHLAYFV